MENLSETPKHCYFSISIYIFTGGSPDFNDEALKDYKFYFYLLNNTVLIVNIYIY
uniref:Uncharacterized protein n=1 Tax=Rhizophora mucronata TaxID=61149 RepID=A0A2P2N1E7_RHIMU